MSISVAAPPFQPRWTPEVLAKDINPGVVQFLARRSPVMWAMHAWGWRRDRRRNVRMPRYRPGPHHDFLEQQLLRIHRGECKRLIVSMPPRHGKTLLTSRFFLGWWLGKHPDHQVLMTTYQAGLVREWSKQIRNDLATHGPAVFGVTASTRAAAERWTLLPMPGQDEDEVVDGGVTAVGTGGAMTGRGADILLGDDLVSGSEPMRSAPQRDHMGEWFERDLMSRLEPDGAALIIMTRWHSDDIPGRIIRSQEAGSPIGGEPWETINLPALAEENDPMGRAPGEALWEARWPRAKLERMRDGMSPYAWSSLYQGRPVPSEGGLFQQAWLSYYHEQGPDLCSVGSGAPFRTPANGLLRYVTVDPAFSKKDSADYTVIASWGLDVGSGRLFLLDLQRARMHAHEVSDAIRAALTRWGATICYVEANNLKQDQMQVIRRSGLPMREIQPNTDKIARAMPATAHMASGLLVFRQGAPWLPDLERELLTFAPGCEHDDQVDVVSYGVHQALELVRASGPPAVPPPALPAARGAIPQLARPW